MTAGDKRTPAQDRGTSDSGASARLRRAQERVAVATREARTARIAAAPDLRTRARARSRWLRGGLAVGAAVSVALAAAAIVLAVLGARAQERTDTQDDVLAAARTAATTMLTSDPAHADAYVEKVLAGSTGAQHDRLERARPALTEAIAAQPAPSAGRVLSAGLISDPGGSDPGAHAEALLVVQASNPVLVGGDPQADRLTLRFGMTRTGSGWLVDSAVPA
ncbi:hypothetical protein ACLQ3C_19605 [Gordonia sp. DT30]|uniref:hypothetical protein n=1 Tax=unclassified Gordonia (in: high G+C Gram-positive bacteria) TaxID=2657482 RepID=UPI003CEA9AFE